MVKQHEWESETLGKNRISRSRIWSRQRQLDFTLMNSLFWHALAPLAKAAFLTHSWVWPPFSSLASSSPYCWLSHLYSHMVNQSGELRNNTILAKFCFSQTSSPIRFTVQRPECYSSTRKTAGGHEGRKLLLSWSKQGKTRQVKALASSHMKTIHISKSNFKRRIKK